MHAWQFAIHLSVLSVTCEQTETVKALIDCAAATFRGQCNEIRSLRELWPALLLKLSSGFIHAGYHTNGVSQPIIGVYRTIIIINI